VLFVAGWAATLASCAYLLLALWRMARFRLPTVTASGRCPPITVLKPLCGDEPRLYQALRSLCTNACPGLQIVFGTRSADDPALLAARRLVDEFPSLDIAVVVDPLRHGANDKVSNLINMMWAAKHALIAISDSDTVVAPGELAQVVAAFDDARVGAVTCLYKAAPIQGWPSVLGAMFIDGWFLSSAVVDAGRGPVAYRYGPLSVVRRSALEAIGGLAALADHLADDFMLGQLIARAGWQVVLAPLAVRTVVAEGWRSLLRHELRWARTVRACRPVEHALSVVTHALPLSLLTLAVPSLWSLGAIVAPLGLRLALHALTNLPIMLPLSGS